MFSTRHIKPFAAVLILAVSVLSSLATSHPVGATSVGCATWNSLPSGSTDSSASDGQIFRGGPPANAWDSSDVIKVAVTGTGTGTIRIVSFGGTNLSGPIAVPGVVTFSGPYNVGDNANAFFDLQVTSGTLDYDPSCVIPNAPAVGSVFSDGRLNQDAGQTAAVYFQTRRDANGLPQREIEVWAVVNGKGIKAFTVTQAELDAVDYQPAVNTLIKQGQGVRLYRLTSGQLLLIGPSLDPTKPMEEYKFYFN